MGGIEHAFYLPADASAGELQIRTVDSVYDDWQTDHSSYVDRFVFFSQNSLTAFMRRRSSLVV